MAARLFNNKGRLDCASLEQSLMKKIIPIFLFLFSLKSLGQQRIPSAEIASHMGDSVTICDKVYGARYLERISLTMMNVGKEFPNQLLTLVIKGADRSKFNFKPEDVFAGRRVCVTGRITEYAGKPQIVITEPRQIKLE